MRSRRLPVILLSSLFVALRTASSNPEQIVATGDKLFFTADDGAHGRELWELPLP
jgi:hypothetical protein